ncbi:MAG: hypothetical protein ACKVS6_02270 [Planctomycetota bacterium]
MLWKISFIITLGCVVPYVIFFGMNRELGVGPMPVLILGTLLAWACMYYVLFKSTELPKK